MRFPRLLTLALGLVSAGSMMLGCGTVSAAGAAPYATVATLGGMQVAKLGFGEEGGTDPAICRRADGSTVVVYVGSNVADRKLYWATAKKGLTFGASQPVGDSDYSDQEPCLVEDAQGQLHLFFASNRDGENFRLYHSQLVDGEWATPSLIPGFEGLQGLAAAYAGGRFLLAAELMGEGLFATVSADGQTFTDREAIAESGFEPAATFLPDGTALVVYQRAGELFFRSSGPNADWSAEAKAAKGADRLRTPALAWAGDHGELIYCERAGTSYQLKAKRFDAKLTFTDGRQFSKLPGEARTPAISAQQNAEINLAWGMKLSSDQTGIAITVLED